jgi:hypothetical protein
MRGARSRTSPKICVACGSRPSELNKNDAADVFVPPTEKISLTGPSPSIESISSQNFGSGRSAETEWWIAKKLPMRCRRDNRKILGQASACCRNTKSAGDRIEGSRGKNPGRHDLPIELIVIDNEDAWWLVHDDLRNHGWSCARGFRIIKSEVPGVVKAQVSETPQPGRHA